MTETKKTPLILETKNLVKKFGGLTVANNINFSMPAGELRCLIGPNGAGKSNFFNLITGIVRPTQGEIFLAGRNITNLSSYKIARFGVARSFQVPNIYNSLSVFENIRIAAQQKMEVFNPFASAKKLDETTEKVLAMLDRFNLVPNMDIYASKLDHGEKKMLEIAIALACEPKLLLLDEPAAGLTTAETEEIIPIIKDISSQKVSILLIEHDTKLVKRIADTITVLHRGTILTEGSPDEIEVNEDVQNIYLGGKQEWS